MKFLFPLFAAIAALAAEMPRFTPFGVIVPDQPLLHTEMALGETAESALSGLATRVLAGAKPVKINAYLRRAEDEPAVRQAIAERYSPVPALTCVVTALPGGSNFAFDAVAPTDRTGLGVLPAGGVAYVSGQAEKGADLREATHQTMKSLAATLQFLGSDWSGVVQVKAFVQPMSDSVIVFEELRKFFPGPKVLVEWIGGSVPVEIEMIVSCPDAKEAIEFLTPPGLKASPVYCRVVRLAAGPRIYLSGLSATGDAGAQVRGVFAQLQTALDATGSDLKHLAKATYYVAADDVSKALNELRPYYYDPQRPPAASKATVQRIGSGSSTFTMDMIAVPPR